MSWFYNPLLPVVKDERPSLYRLPSQMYVVLFDRFSYDFNVEEKLHKRTNTFFMHDHDSNGSIYNVMKPLLFRTLSPFTEFIVY